MNKTKHPVFEAGQKVLCCGGVPAIILAVSVEKVLVMRLPRSGGESAPSFVVGHYPLQYGGELVWDHGHYHISYNEYPVEQALSDAVQDYMSE